MNILYFNSLNNRDVIPLMSCLNFTVILFMLGLVGIVWNKRNLLVMIFCIEIMFFSVSLNFALLSIYTYNGFGQVITLMIITTAASETAVGLSLLVVSHRLSGKLSYASLISLRG